MLTCHRMSPHLPAEILVPGMQIRAPNLSGLLEGRQALVCFAFPMLGTFQSSYEYSLSVSMSAFECSQTRKGLRSASVSVATLPFPSPALIRQNLPYGDCSRHGESVPLLCCNWGCIRGNRAEGAWVCWSYSNFRWPPVPHERAVDEQCCNDEQTEGYCSAIGGDPGGAAAHSGVIAAMPAANALVTINPYPPKRIVLIQPPY